ncbi:methylene-tetrahydromethanopterin reductase [candidate division MSBL1 archaeon SCGC-AAA261D19]|uniref:5,10-methylenetetrahydromethanopterin reductase n=1 Tax=candidate division MSBL1 archaeon SCGC-AAA261D19 TaxID=1698273 RepID=A0A133V6J0_9EURY|nr:methylene-tetrahydromethanopterin reductase [candidate division MSBL1 archaeon SCGC-AAA261D19]
MDFGVEFVPEDPIDDIVEEVKVAEDSGFDYVWITDHYNNRNVYVTLSRLAVETEKIKLGPGVTNVYTIHPAETASSIATIDELSGGRATLGIGPGDKTTLNALGLEWDKPLTRTREGVEIIRDLLAGEKVTFEGEKFKLHGARLNFKPKSEIPIYIGAQGPKMLKMGGEFGDGVLINASHPADFDFAVDQVNKGIKKAGKKKSDVEVTAYTSFSVAEERKAAKKAAMPVVAFIVAGVPDVVLERHGISKEDAKKVKKPLGEGDFGTAFGSVTGDMIDAFSVYGTPEECIERIKGLSKVGVSQIVTGSPIGPDKEKAIELIGEEIIPEI